MMLNLLIYFLLAYGICNIIIFANGPFHIFIKMHSFFKKHMPMMEEMTSCFICLPVWSGFFLSALNILLFPTITFTPMMMVGLPMEYWYLTIFFDGLITSGGCWLMNTIQEALERTNSNG